VDFWDTLLIIAGIGWLGFWCGYLVRGTDE
jgi:hypothetical protein